MRLVICLIKQIWSNVPSVELEFQGQSQSSECRARVPSVEPEFRG